MTDDKFKVCINIIRQCRELDKFTNKTVAQLLCMSAYRVRGYTNTLYNIGCIKKIGGVARGRTIIPDFVVADDAITKLYQCMREYTGEIVPVATQQPDKPRHIEFCGRVVEKAYIDPEFGRSDITRFDSLLMGVRGQREVTING
ncbi:hypothetical protein [Morganella psychrotolerans]|uniref:DNA-binding protein n=1 Tax=Morganella psychrotolerans TaxID=368603 RepID=A0A1B8H6Y9_9GAMM|nr:hypothetical protein [Morganella psychrotolerans]OBU04826.1 hypothetical protein AYY17_07995 [Morganella psychrotolerans]